MHTREPEFMRDLHKIRERLAKKWAKMSSEEFLNSLHDSSQWMKKQQALARSKKVQKVR